ncbi:uncharacterized protein [Euwallacea fornicatus]|uniref:uncharacterized protein n=1 Tax=Euwallacea fornicatus TaxID=995702 RepID=UPI00338F0F99
MNRTSKTGLAASPTKSVPKFIKTQNIQLRAIAKPAPYKLKPYSGLYNPYPSGCSLLCNHPMDKQAKELFQKVKENWTNDERCNSLLAEEIDAIKASLSKFSCGERHLITQIDSVPEELFRRYTDTDSRPLTPAPTLASGATRASGSRRCVTPEAGGVRPKAQLVLDLRRTHSQETISYNASLQDPPIARAQNALTKATSLEEIPCNRKSATINNLLVPSPRKAKTAIINTKKLNFSTVTIEPTKENPEEKMAGISPSNKKEEDYVKRRGKRRKKKERDPFRGPPAFQVPIDPETQVAAIATDSPCLDARTSCAPNQSQDGLLKKSSSQKGSKLLCDESFAIESYLNTEILKQLRRELNEDLVDSELNLNRRKALEEALKGMPKDKTRCRELLELQDELKIPKLNEHLWIYLPRTFTRSSARFELPMNSISLSKMTPIEYLQENVSISSERKLLFNCIFNKFKTDIDSKVERKMSSHVLQEALDLLMGRPMMPEEATRFRNLVGWGDSVDFKTFCGIAALCERIMAPSYFKRLTDRKIDPSHEIEMADFELLARKINKQLVDKRLIQILCDIQTL